MVGVVGDRAPREISQEAAAVWVARMSLIGQPLGRGRFSIRWGVGDLSGGGGSNGVRPQGLMRVAPGRVGSMRVAPGQVRRRAREWDPVASGRCGGSA
jgi:hypothetical protein